MKQSFLTWPLEILSRCDDKGGSQNYEYYFRGPHTTGCSILRSIWGSLRETTAIVHCMNVCSRQVCLMVSG